MQDRVNKITHVINRLMPLLLAYSYLFMIAPVAHSQQAGAINGPLRVSTLNSRYFTDNSGKAIALSGSHTWGNFVDVGPSNNNLPSGLDNISTTATVEGFVQYLDFLKKYNHNFIRLWRWELTYWKRYTDLKYRYSSPHPWKRTGPGSAKDGLLKFDLKQFEQSYFDRLRERVIAAGNRGIYVSVMLFEGNALYFPEYDTWVGHPYNINNNVNNINGDLNSDGQGVEIHTLSNSQIVAFQEAYVRKVIDTVNDLDNVLYEVGNEIGSYSIPFQYHIINLVKSYEKTKPKQHPIGMTHCYHRDTKYWSTHQDLRNSPADWISPGGEVVQTADYVTNPVVNDGKKVVLADNDHLGWRQRDAAWLWKIFMRGHSPIWMDAYFGLNGNGPWLYDMQADIEKIRKYQGYILTYATKMNLIAMVPSNSASDCSTTYCLRNPGKEYFIYQPTSSTAFSVNLVSGSYTYEWFNLLTGSIAQTGSFSASSGNRNFTPPFAGEALLYIKSSSTTDATAPAAPTG
ncbi:MAG: hypothetical protein IT291_02890, partial [Deltaproteobacteria bacterium]|nr:hypothetical protein [Deltaproteobacteria bacterium]